MPGPAQTAANGKRVDQKAWCTSDNLTNVISVLLICLIAKLA